MDEDYLSQPFILVSTRHFRLWKDYRVSVPIYNPSRVHPGDTYFQDWSFSRSVFVNTLERSLDRSISATRIQFRLSGFPRSSSLFHRLYMHIYIYVYADYLFLQQPNGTDRNRCFSQNGQNGRTFWSKKKRLRIWKLVGLEEPVRTFHTWLLSSDVCRVSQCLTRFKRKNTCAIPGSLGQAAPSQSNMPGTSGFGVYGVETTTGTIYRDLLLWTWVQKSPVKHPWIATKLIMPCLDLCTNILKGFPWSNQVNNWHSYSNIVKSRKWFWHNQHNQHRVASPILLPMVAISHNFTMNLWIKKICL